MEYHAVGKTVVGEPRMPEAQGEGEEEEEAVVVVVVEEEEEEEEGCWIAGNGTTRAAVGQAGQWRASRRDWAARIGVVGGSEAGRWDGSPGRSSPEGRAVAGPPDCNPLLPAAANPIDAEGQAATSGVKAGGEVVGPRRRSPDSAAVAAAAVVGDGTAGNAAAAGVAAGTVAGAGAEDGTAAAAVGENR